MDRIPSLPPTGSPGEASPTGKIAGVGSCLWALRPCPHSGGRPLRTIGGSLSGGNERPPTVPLVRLTPRTVDAPTTVRLQGVGALAPRIDLACSEGMTARISSLSAGDRAGTVLPESMRRMVKVSARVARVSLFAAMVVLGLLGALLREMLRSLDQSDPSDPWGPHLSGF